MPRNRIRAAEHRSNFIEKRIVGARSRGACRIGTRSRAEPVVSHRLRSHLRRMLCTPAKLGPYPIVRAATGAGDTSAIARPCPLAPGRLGSPQRNAERTLSKLVTKRFEPDA